MYYSLEGPEALKMRLAYIGDQTVLWLDNLHECLYVARMAGSHLHNGNVVVGGEPEERLGHTYIVVEIALGEKDIETLREHRRDKFLCGGLAVGACDADDGNVELAAVVTRQELESAQAVIDNDIPWVYPSRSVCHGTLRFINNSKRASLLQCSGSKLVSIERPSLQCNEDGIGWTVTAVGCYYRVAFIYLIKLFYVHFTCFLCKSTSKMAYDEEKEDNFCKIYLFLFCISHKMCYICKRIKTIFRKYAVFDKRWRTADESR